MESAFSQFHCGFVRCQSDSCLYTKPNSELFVLLYIDDLALFGANLQQIQLLKQQLSKEFEMTDLDEINTFLGIHIERNIENGEMQLSQKQYLINVLEKFQMSDCKPISTPMEIKLKLEKGDDSEASTKPYRELIGCLMYVTLTTRPDLAAATNYFSRFQSNSTDEYFMYAKRILKYIKGTLDLKLK